MWGPGGDVVRSLARQSQLVALGALFADLAQLLLRFPAASGSVAYWLVCIAVIVADLALAAPARWSGRIAVAHAAVMLTAGILLYDTPARYGGNDAGVMIAGYRVGAWLRGWPGIAAMATLFAGAILTRMHNGDFDLAHLSIVGVKSSILPWLVGRYTTARRAYLAELDRKADNDRRDAQQAIAEAVLDERRAIALDLHDMISHHVSAIGVHAGAARLGLAAAQGESGARNCSAATRNGTLVLAKALDEVESSSHAAMDDLRRMLDLLHGNDGDGMRQPGLANLDELIDGVRAAGLRVRMDVTGAHFAPLPGSLDIALYRITQEMLTNALRHGDGSVHLRIERDAAGLTVSSENPLPPDPAPAADPVTHRGLAGIRRRAVLFDGRVDHGPDPARRSWRTAVTFPLAKPVAGEVLS
ncbi:sensor histidine kinase [Nocardia arthritidis]|uniref:histidine kinase n=1 Tax=Nocardia arthritidis TaxID=228602 RepID=A0A6G9YEL0_9NOCA|nr:histidine kinase [Nocardia arthritidis]QIS11632.1 two-component sensor histidine kinase [Nocardia arthritidis]